MVWLPQLYDGVALTPMTKWNKIHLAYIRDFGLVDSGLVALQQYTLHGALKQDVL